MNRPACRSASNRSRGRRGTLAPIAALAGLLLAWATADAHRMPGSLSTVKVNERTGSVEVIHRLHNHDAELGVKMVMKDSDLSLEQLIGRAHLALYVESHFLVAPVVDGEAGEPLELELIGAELDGEFILVYQEFRGALPAEIAVRDDILRDVFPEQVNQVNISTGGRVHSLTFQDDDTWLTALLE